MSGYHKSGSLCEILDYFQGVPVIIDYRKLRKSCRINKLLFRNK